MPDHFHPNYTLHTTAEMPTKLTKAVCARTFGFPLSIFEVFRFRVRQNSLAVPSIFFPLAHYLVVFYHHHTTIGDFGKVGPL